jgi:hypothetical protein
MLDSPRPGIFSFEVVASALVELAAPATNARVGQQMGVSPAGGKFRSKLGTARYYGLTRREGNLLSVTPRGEAIVSGDEDAARQARREAVLGTAFGPIIRRFAGREPNETTIAARLEDDCGVPVGSSKALGHVLIRAAHEAELISGGRFDAAAIESVPAVSSDQNGSGAATRRETQPSASGAPVAKAPERMSPEKHAERRIRHETAQLREEPRPFPIPVRVVVNVDAASWSAEQVMEFLKALREPVESISEVTEPRS